jgi:ferrous iron transport protein A
MDILTAHAADLLAAVDSQAIDTSRYEEMSLADLPRGASATVAGVSPSALAEDGDLVRRLIEIGFVAGEPVRVVAHGVPGREPVAVRLGTSTFALRRFEAQYVRVYREGAPRS